MPSAEFEHVADHAAYGETLNDLDAFLLIEGRAPLKEIFEQKHQERIVKKEQTQKAAQCTKLTVIISVEKRKRTIRKRKT